MNTVALQSRLYKYASPLIVGACLFILLVPLAYAETWDARMAALYGDQVRPVKYVVTNITLAGDVLDENAAKSRELKKRMDAALYDMAKNISKPEFGLELSMRFPNLPSEEQSSVMILNIELVIKRGSKFSPALSNSVAVAIPVFGRPRIQIAYPYYNYDTPALFAISENEQETLKTFEDAVRPMITHGLQAVVCRNPKNTHKEHPLCEVPKQQYLRGILPEKS